MSGRFHSRFLGFICIFLHVGKFCYFQYYILLHFRLECYLSYQSVDRNLNYFQFGTILNDAALHILVQVSGLLGT